MNLFRSHDPSLESSTPCCWRAGRIKKWLGLFGAPAAWIAQVSISEPLAAHACYPYQTPLTAPILKGLPAILAAVSIICFAAGLLSGFIAWTSWRQHEAKRAEEGRRVIKKGQDRNRFLMKLSLMSSFIFIVAIIFNICAVLLVSPCSSWF